MFEEVVSEYANDDKYFPIQIDLCNYVSELCDAGNNKDAITILTELAYNDLSNYNIAFWDFIEKSLVNNNYEGFHEFLSYNYKYMSSDLKSLMDERINSLLDEGVNIQLPVTDFMNFKRDVDEIIFDYFYGKGCFAEEDIELFLDSDISDELKIKIQEILDCYDSNYSEEDYNEESYDYDDEDLDL